MASLVSHARLDLALLEKAQEAVSLLARLERDQKVARAHVIYLPS